MPLKLETWTVFILSLITCTTALKGHESTKKFDPESDLRENKVFSLFSIVTFKNSGCRSESGTTGSGVNRNGTCYTSTECSDKGGMASGNCAAGFGVCCLFILNTASSLSASENCTYIQNPGFPSTYSSSSTLTYTVNKCNPEVCYLRIDLETFTLVGPTTLEADASAHPCIDTFSVTGSGGVSSPTICGKNAGEHVYVDMGTSSSGTATITFTFPATPTSTVRTWELKLTQIECTNISRPPSGCLQYFTGLTGRLSTFNFQETTLASQAHLMNQMYSICIRPEAGYCCVQYSLCTDTFSWNIDINAAPGTALIDTACGEDYLGISGISDTCSLGTNTQIHSKICGAAFGVSGASTVNAPSLCDCTQPFTVDVATENTQDAIAPAAIQNSRGACLNFQQVACANLV